MAMDEIRTSSPAPSSGMSRPEGMGTGRNTSRSGLVVGLLVLLIIVLALLWISGTEQAPESGDTVTTEIAPGTTLTEVPAGDIVDGFPEKLILEDDVVAEASYAIAYTEGDLSQPVLSYRSVKTLDENIAAYGAYLSLNSWSVTHAASADETPTTFFYAYKENTEVNITFAPENDTVLVTIAYVSREPAE
ncbi:MAG TPA: hypothetical protein VJ837_04825 [Candidatus Paceibacterota bacterium]|nr:hypothetical protein [Candidatus Paceibacterota bacterium]